MNFPVENRWFERGAPESFEKVVRYLRVRRLRRLNILILLDPDTVDRLYQYRYRYPHFPGER